MIEANRNKHMKPIDVALAIVIKKQRVLVQQRYRKQKGLCFEFPGGRIDPDETAQKAAQRELWEETGIQETNVLSSYTSCNQWGGRISYVILKLHADVEPRMTNPQRQQRFFWYHMNEIPISEFPPADQAFIQNHLHQYIL